MKALIRDTNISETSKYLKGDVIVIVPDSHDFSPRELQNNRVINLTEDNLEYDLLRENKKISMRGISARMAMRMKLQPVMIARRQFYFDDSNIIKRRN